VSRGISSGSSRSTSGHYRDSNSGSGSSKWDGGRREEDRCGACAGVHVSTSGCNRSPGVHESAYPACNSIPGSGLDGATGYQVPECQIGCPLDEVVHLESCWCLNTLNYLGIAMSVNPSCPSGLLQPYAYAGARLAPLFIGPGVVVKAGGWLASRLGVRVGSRLTEKLILQGSKGVVAKSNIAINRFHVAAKELSKTGQNNIRTLRGWAKSKGWVKQANPRGGPETRIATQTHR